MPGVIRPSGVRLSSIAPTYTATVGCVSKSFVTPDREPIAANYVHSQVFMSTYVYIYYENMILEQQMDTL